MPNDRGGLPLNTIEQPPAISRDVAGVSSVGLVVLSPGVVMLGLNGGLPGIDPSSISLASDSGPVEPPISWQRVPAAGAEISLLLARAQPGLAAGAMLWATDHAGAAAALSLHEVPDLQSLLGPLPPAAILRVLGFIASRAAGMLRRADDAALAAACNALAGHARAPDRVAVPGARCGADTVFWSLPAAMPAAPGTSFVIGRHRIRRVGHAGGAMVTDRRFEGGTLLPALGEGPIHLASRTEPLPTLGELARRQDAPSRAIYRAAVGELARRAPEDDECRRLLRDHQLLAPARPISQAIDPKEPFGGALELAVDDHAGGLFLRGWLRDPLKLVSQLSLHGSFGEQAAAARPADPLPALRPGEEIRRGTAWRARQPGGLRRLSAAGGGPAVRAMAAPGPAGHGRRGDAGGPALHHRPRNWRATASSAPSPRRM